MSVINRMLKDIENRNQNETVESLVGQVVATPEKDKLQKIIIVSLAFLVVLLGGYLVVDKLTTQSSASDSQIAQQQSIATLTNAPQLTVPNNEVSEQQATSSEQPKLSESVTKQQQPEPVKKISEADKPGNNDVTSNAHQQQPKLVAETKPSEQTTSVVKSAPKLTATQEAQNFYQQAQAALAKSDTSGALELLATALSFDANLHSAKILQLSLLAQQGIDINDTLDVQIEQFPEVFHYRQIKARLLLESGAINEAQKLLESELPVMTEAPDYYATLAYIAQQQGSAKQAADYYQQLLRIQPAKADWWFGLAIANQQMANNQLALQAYQQSLKAVGLAQNLRDYAAQQIKVLQGN